jgi:hypothetical protein
MKEISEEQFVECLNHYDFDNIDLENNLIDPYEPICKVCIIYYENGKPVLKHKMRSTGKCQTDSYILLDKNYEV